MARLARDSRAAVIVEMAFTIPFMILIGFAGLEIANLTLANTRISQISLSAADNASRIAFGNNLSLPRVRELDINSVFTGVEEQAGGLNFKQNGRIILSSLERNTSGGQWIHWQRCYGDLVAPSSYGVQGNGATGTSFAGMGPAGRKVTAATGTAVMFVEVTYRYQPMLYGKWLGAKTIRSTAAFNIREARDLQGPQNGDGVYQVGTKSSCT
ncbi:TadE/TadG family type IV pilus assembly protein [Sphingopyxis sp. KK2]|uniref:TadE/TadG family type IV pilus assembly protein n=1 Tax=Sphingopyxis sp. KK2 TaxID=1855727 RepID=UPI0021179D43|nr:hypothetical protein [Sphingopyxis sp. KK2]